MMRTRKEQKLHVRLGRVCTRNEARLIRQTLQSVLEAADRAVILDTGSTDGTQDAEPRDSPDETDPLDPLDGRCWAVWRKGRRPNGPLEGGG